jgi:hypothetical protein
MTNLSIIDEIRQRQRLYGLAPGAQNYIIECQIENDKLDVTRQDTEISICTNAWING